MLRQLQKQLVLLQKQLNKKVSLNTDGGGLGASCHTFPIFMYYSGSTILYTM